MKGSVYKLFFNDDIYVGSTFDKLCSRLCKHRDVARKQRSDTKCYKTMYEKGANNFIIELLEEIECNTKEELRLKEQEWIDKINPNMNTIKAQPIVNDKVALKEYHHIYYETNKDILLTQNKQYRDTNADAIKSWKKEKVECSICKKMFCRAFLKNHSAKCDGTNARKRTGRKKKHPVSD